MGIFSTSSIVVLFELFENNSATDLVLGEILKPVAKNLSPFLVLTRATWGSAAAAGSLFFVVVRSVFCASMESKAVLICTPWFTFSSIAFDDVMNLGYCLNAALCSPLKFAHDYGVWLDLTVYA